jgi:hypothetical protein
MNRRSIGIAVFVVVVIFIIIGVFSLGNRQRGGNTTTPSPTPKPTPKPVTLTDYVNDDAVTVQFTVNSRIIAKEKHVVQTISVAKAHRDMNAFREYTGLADPSMRYDNNQPAFEDFMRALNNAGFTRTTPNSKAKDTELGLCPSGNRFVYEVIRNGETLFRAWSTTCNDPTTFTGNPSVIRTLFQNQIPDFSKLNQL